MIVPVVKTPAASPNQAPSEEDPNLVHLGCISLFSIYISISQFFSNCLETQLSSTSIFLF